MPPIALHPSLRWLPALCAAALVMLSSASSSAQDIPNAARLGFIQGDVSIQPAGVDAWGQAYPNLPLGPGDRIVTAPNSRAEIQIGQTYVRMGQNADVTFVSDSPDAIVFGLAQGSVHIHSFGLWPNQSVQVNSPSGNTTIWNAGEYRADVFPDQGATVYTAFTTPAEVNWVDTRGPQTRPIQNGWAIELWGSNPAGSQWMQPTPPDILDNFSFERDRQIANAASFRYVSPYIPGAFELDAAGDWQPGSPYGAVWFPRAVPAGWAPYHYGHWVNHAPWGWMWVEDESWGYAPFHYGRWVTIGGRWGWIPGPPAARPIFAPALVVFAGGIQVGGVGVSAWFPLGPGEPYRPWYPCPPAYINNVNISNITATNVVHVQTNYVNIVNVTNVTNITYVNRTVGVTAMNQSDFAAGRPASQVAVKVAPQQLEHVTVVNQIQVKPAQTAIVGRAPAHPVAVKTERPALINRQGQLAVAKPGAKPVPPPVRPVAAAKPLPGHQPAASLPPGEKAAAPAKAEPAKPEEKPAPASAAHAPASAPAKPADHAAPAAKPADHAATPAKPAEHTAQPTAAKPAQHEAPSGSAPKPAEHAAPSSTENKPADRTAAKPEDKANPAAKPGTKPGTKPEDKNKKPEDKDKKPEPDTKPE
jgi:hypothetical protein